MAAETVSHAAEAASAHGFNLVPIVVLLGAAVIVVPLFRRLGLGSVLGVQSPLIPTARQIAHHDVNAE